MTIQALVHEVRRMRRYDKGFEGLSIEDSARRVLTNSLNQEPTDVDVVELAEAIRVSIAADRQFFDDWAGIKNSDENKYPGTGGGQRIIRKPEGL